MSGSRRTMASPPRGSGQIDGNNRAAEPDARQALWRGLRPDVQNRGPLLLHLSDDGTSSSTMNRVSSAKLRRQEGKAGGKGGRERIALGTRMCLKSHSESPIAAPSERRSFADTSLDKVR